MMKCFNTLADLDAVKTDPELWREIYGYMQVCAAEIREYADEIDLEEHDFNTVLITETEEAYLLKLGVPEEMSTVTINLGHQQRVIQRWVYVAEVVYLDCGIQPASKSQPLTT